MRPCPPPRIEHLEGRLVPAALTPNDPSFPDQYALPRVSVPAAWGATTGTGATVVAVIDSGVDATHSDLAENVWRNPGEVPGNGIDDDRDGYVDDVAGYDFADDDADPADPDGHGTHVAGVIGARGGNAVGVAGVDWRATLMPLRFLDATGAGTGTNAARAVDYAVAHGARVINASWTVPADPALEAAVGRARAAGVLIVAAAGNGGTDLDAAPTYPAAYAARYDNVVAVASTDAADRLAATSNYGRTTVTLAAPGVGIESTLPGGRYGRESGTSQAAGFVTGAVALAWDAHPEWDYRAVVAALVRSVDAVPGLAGKVATGGRLNVARFLGADLAPPLPRQFAAGSDRGTAAAAVLFNTDGSARLRVNPFPATFTGGVRVAAADVTGDGVAELVAGSGPGDASHVRVYDGATGAELFAVDPFEAAFVGGVYVAAGDVTGDGVPDLVVTPDEGGGPRVRVYDGRTRAVVADFLGIDDPNFRGGARAAVGDFDGDGAADLVVAAGFGGGPRVAVYDGRSLGGAPRTLFSDFFLFEPALRNGAFVAVGDVDGDGFADLVGGGGPGGAPRVLVLSGADLLAGAAGGAGLVANFFAGDATARGGARVAVKDLDGDQFADLVVGDGAGAGGRATGYSGRAFAGGLAPAAFALDALPGQPGGVFVG